MKSLKGLSHRLSNHPGPDAPFWVTPVLVLWSFGVGSLLLGSMLILTACRGEEPHGTADGTAKVAAVEEGAVPATPAAAPGVPSVEGLAPPSPSPALNRYTESCLSTPTGSEVAGERAAACGEHLLETLRAVIGYRELPQAEVGPRLDRAEVAVRHLGVDPAGEDAAPLARQAALDLVALMDSVSAYVDGTGSADLAAARSAAASLDPEQPLAAQGDRLDAFFRAADAVVRPLVRSASPAPPADPA